MQQENVAVCSPVESSPNGIKIIDNRFPLYSLLFVKILSDKSKPNICARNLRTRKNIPCNYSLATSHDNKWLVKLMFVVANGDEYQILQVRGNKYEKAQDIVSMKIKSTSKLIKD
jgi:hypothetical protein